MARTRRDLDEEYELNLAPIMNMVMILIPLLLFTASFFIVATLDVHSPQQASAVTPQEQPEEEVLVPRLSVAVTADGFIIDDLRQSQPWIEAGWASPIAGCNLLVGPGEVPPTVCNMSDRAGEERLINRLDYRGLYNRLVEIRQEPTWASQWDTTNDIINVVADDDIEFEVIIRTMDVSRFFLGENSYDSDEAFRVASYRVINAEADPTREADGYCAKFACLFSHPVLMTRTQSAE